MTGVLAEVEATVAVLLLRHFMDTFLENAQQAMTSRKETNRDKNKATRNRTSGESIVLRNWYQLPRHHFPLPRGNPPGSRHRGELMLLQVYHRQLLLDEMLQREKP